MDVKGAFHVDKVQEIVSKYASEAFEVEVVFVESGVALHPVLSVPAGVRVPVAIKKPLSGAKGELLKVGEVPFRTLNANNRVSTAAARPEDWRDVVAVCFDNREADVAGFLRRQLSGLTPDLLRTFVGLQQGSSTPPLEQISAEFRDACFGRFNDLAKTVDVKAQVSWGGWEVGLVLSPGLTGLVADKSFLSRVFSANPSYSSWPIWLDTRYISRGSLKHRNGGWGAFVAFDAWYNVLDFYRFEPEGRFYAYRPYFDDGIAETRQAKPKVILDPVPLIADVGEAIALGLLFAQALGATANSQLAFSWRWSGLAGRALMTLSPADLGSHLLGQDICHDDEVTDFVVVPVSTSAQAVAPYAVTCTRRLFAAFNGFSVQTKNVDRIVESRLNRQRP
jgi:hypothetical protein